MKERRASQSGETVRNTTKGKERDVRGGPYSLGGIRSPGGKGVTGLKASLSKEEEGKRGEDCSSNSLRKSRYPAWSSE